MNKIQKARGRWLGYFFAKEISGSWKCSTCEGTVVLAYRAYSNGLIPSFKCCEVCSWETSYHYQDETEFNDTLASSDGYLVVFQEFNDDNTFEGMLERVGE